MYNHEWSSPTVTQCTFSGNSAVDGQGGGMHNRDHSSPTLTQCTFTGNSARGGGAMRNGGPSPVVTHCTFTGNSARGGGAMNNWRSSPVVTHCTFTGNSANGGGAMYNRDSALPTVTHCTFTGNSANVGGAMRNLESSSPVITHCTFTANSADDGGGVYNQDSSPTVTLCILRENSGGAIYNDGDASEPEITYSCVQTGYSGDGNIDADPLFVEAPSPGPDGGWGTEDDAGDLRLQAGSPCIDLRTADGISMLDLAGNLRPQGDALDMGAYEFVGRPLHSLTLAVEGTGPFDGIPAGR